MAHYVITNLNRDGITVFRFPDNRKAETKEDWERINDFACEAFPGDDVEFREVTEN